jgi:hypothetical protein
MDGTSGLVNDGGYPLPGLVSLNAIKLFVPTHILVPLIEVVALVGNVTENGRLIDIVESSPGVPTVLA